MKWRIAIICYMCTVLACAFALQTRKPCRPLQTEQGYVCVCDDDYCDTLDVPLPKASNEYILVTSSKAGDRFSYEKGNVKQPNKFSESSSVYISIDSTKVYQKILGFGGAITGAITYITSRLPPNLRTCLYKSYFSRTVGMGYSYIRIPIGGCDFDFEPWAFKEFPENDYLLSNFTQLDPRDLARNEILKELPKLTRNPNIKILAAAWSAPLWMKADKKWYGLPNNQLNPEFYDTWAKYHLRWLELMEKDDVIIWALSTGNEPYISMVSTLFEEMNWNATEQGKYLADHLGPTVKNSRFPNVELHGYDDSRQHVFQWIEEMKIGNERCVDYLSGFGIYGYFDAKTISRQTSLLLGNVLRRRFRRFKTSGPATWILAKVNSLFEWILICHWLYY